MSTRTVRATGRALAVTILAGLALVLGAAPALAHAQFEGSDPADGASLATAPTRVTVSFSDKMQQGFNTLTVIGPDRQAYQDGEPVASGNTVSVGVKPLGPAGRYDIGYRVVSDDGHPIEGSVSFTLTTPGPAAATAPTAPAAAEPAPAAAVAPDEGSGGAPIWPWIVGAVVLVGGGVVVALRLGRG
ncbi:copper resistance CopC family protein [Pseudonocardia bannensis]|uniref:Copper resistance protein CopC n=1 Tax=Pseudonocardia bannensis TaxID=630973 RepID=A0A848DMF9_9PSEU|nr:copper resistance CopC family protein [Pseudonocardia bannensis]NMH93970.1 copper resistance protein CopC [Pseudonocardia bannensis]